MKSTLILSAATLFFSAAQAQVTDTTGRNTNTGTTTNTMGTTNTTGTTGADTGNTSGSTSGTTTGTTSSGMGTTNDVSATGVDNSRKLNQYGSYSTRDSIAAKYKLLPMPGALSIEKTFPILGTYQLNTTPATGTTTGTGGTTNTSGTTTSGNATAGTGSTTTNATTDATVDAAPQVTITIDSASRGIVWVEGLKQGRLKAYLKKSPATYRVVAQKSTTGVAIPEGTMHLDPATNTLHIALGAPYNETDPTAIFNLSNGTAGADNTAEIKVKTKDTKVKSKVVFITATKVDATQQQQMGTESDATQQTQQSQQEQQ